MNETDRDLAYNMIDRFLRNELDDKDYAEYSSALEQCFTDELLIQQLAIRDAEVAEIRRGNAAAVSAYSTCSEERDQLRDQVKLLRGTLQRIANRFDLGNGKCCGAAEQHTFNESTEALAATKNHDRS